MRQGQLQQKAEMLPDKLVHVFGPNLALHLIQPEDANYVHALRSDPAYNQYLSEVRGTVEDQRRWIEAYKLREANLSELYYVITRRDGTRCGLVRLYDICADGFTWGSWILDHNKTRKAALESAVLSFGVGFTALDLPQALVDVRVGNERAKAFYRRLGMTEIRSDERDIYLIYHRSRFDKDYDGYLAILEGKQA